MITGVWGGSGEQRDFLRSVVNTVHEPLLVLDTSLRVTLANPSFYAAFGLLPEITEGVSVYELANGPWNVPTLRHLMEYVLPRDGVVTNYEVRHTLPDRREQVLFLNARKLHQPGSSMETVLLAFEDVTEQTQAEERASKALDALRISEERYRTLFETVDEGFCLIEMLFDEQNQPIDYIFLEANPAFARHTGLVNGMGKRARELVPDLDEFWFRTYGSVALTGEAVRFENHAPAMGRWFDVYALRVGAPEEHRVALLFNNITDRKQAEEALREAAAKNERIAETLQRSLLLAPPPDAYPGVTVAAIYHSAWDDAQIGGDFFDVFAVDETRVALVVGDATGKGIEAATYTAEIKFALRAFLRVEDGSPPAALTRLSDFIARNDGLDAGHGGGSFVALALVVFDTRTGEAVCACAGSEPPLVLRADAATVYEVAAFGPLLGVACGAPYEELRVHLDAGDLILMTTDGITEARRPRRSKDRAFFGMNGLAQAAREAFTPGATFTNPPALAEVGEFVVEQARAWAGGLQHDDICLLVARRR